MAASISEGRCKFPIVSTPLAHDADAGRVTPLADLLVVQTVDGFVAPHVAGARCGQRNAVQIIGHGVNSQVSEHTVSQLPIFPAAVFEFLAAAAGTRIVAAYFGAGANGFGLLHRRRGFTDDVAAFSGCGFGGTRTATFKSAGGLVHRLLRHITEEILEGHHA